MNESINLLRFDGISGNTFQEQKRQIGKPIYPGDFLERKKRLLSTS